MLDPTPVGLAAGIARRETVVSVIGVEFFLEAGLVPHGIGDHAVELLDAVPGVVLKLGIVEGVAKLDVAFHVVDDHVHLGHGPGGGVLLVVESERCLGFLAPLLNNILEAFYFIHSAPSLIEFLCVLYNSIIHYHWFSGLSL